MADVPTKTISTSVTITLNKVSVEGSISAEVDTRPYGAPCNGLNQKSSFDPGDSVWILVFLPKNTVERRAYPSDGTCSWGGDGTIGLKTPEKLKLVPGDKKTTVTLSRAAAGAVTVVRQAPNNTVNLKTTVPAEDGVTLHTTGVGRGAWWVKYSSSYTALELRIPGDHNPNYEIEVDIEADIPSDEDEC